MKWELFTLNKKDLLKLPLFGSLSESWQLTFLQRVMGPKSPIVKSPEARSPPTR